MAAVELLTFYCDDCFGRSGALAFGAGLVHCLAGLLLQALWQRVVAVGALAVVAGELPPWLLACRCSILPAALCVAQWGMFC